MPDLNDDLFSSFKNEGSPVTPLPASEVRRRGDRMRRRNNTLAAVGGVAAALVVIATPLAVVANQSTDSSEPQPADTPTTIAWPQQIPADFEVRAGMRGDAANPPQDTTDPGVEQVEVCGEVAFDATGDGPVDVRGAHYESTESTEDIVDRTVALYADGASATRAYDSLLNAVRLCGSEPPTEVGDVFEWTASPIGLAADDSALVTRGQIAEGDSFPSLVDYYVVARTGNALLVTHTAGANAQEVADAQRSDAEPVVAEMQRFSADENAPADPTTLLPSGFALDSGMAPDGSTVPAVVTDDLGGDGLLGLTLCDREVWTYRDEYVADARAASWSDGESGGEFRTAATYEAGEPAESAFGSIAQEVATCDDVTVLDVAAGDEAVGYADASGSVRVVVRVGDALLLMQEAPADPADAQATADDLLDRAAPVLDQLADR